MQDLGNTQFFKVETDSTSVKGILADVYAALTEKGYNLLIRLWGISCPEIPHTLPVTKMPEALS